MTDYDPFAAVYVAGAETSAHNALLERPALRALAPPLKGRDVLELGCAGGAHTEWLIGQGARVTALDASARMIELARQRLGDAARFLAHDLAKPLPMSAESFDVVFASLVLHYLPDWRPVLTELRRALRPGGALLISTHHPMADFTSQTDGRYFDIEAMTQTWGGAFDPPITVTFHRRPLRAIFADLAASGFRLDVFDEPEPPAEMASRFPREYEALRRAPAFIVLRAYAI